MSLEGRIHNGTVIFTDPVTLPEGTLVRVEVLPEKSDQAVNGGKTALEVFRDFVGAVDDLPADLSENHDHYLYGTPKRP